MKQSTLSKWLKAVTIGTGIFGLVVFAWLVPMYGGSIATLYPEFAHCYWPWLIYLWLCAVPCFVSLFFGWKIAENIGADNSFSFENAKHLKTISNLALCDSVFFITVNWVYVFLGMNHPGIALIFASLITFVGVAVSIVCAALSHLVYKSAVMKSESDLTI